MIIVYTQNMSNKNNKTKKKWQKKLNYENTTFELKRSTYQAKADSLGGKFVKMNSVDFNGS